MAQPRNPTPKTLYGKLLAAKAALEAGNLIVVSYHALVVSDLDRFGIDEDTYWSLLPRLLEKILSSDPAKCHAGRYPADRISKHKGFNGLEMWAFKTTLPEFPFEIYFKFCVKEHQQTGEIHYCHVDCHPDNPTR